MPFLYEKGEEQTYQYFCEGLQALSESPQFSEMPTWYLHCAQLIIHLHSVIEATSEPRCGIAGGEEKEENIFYVNLVAASMITCSVLHSSGRSCSLIFAENSDKVETNPLGCIACLILFWILPFRRAFNKYFTSKRWLYSVLDALANMLETLVLSKICWYRGYN